MFKQVSNRDSGVLMTVCFVSEFARAPREVMTMSSNPIPMMPAHLDPITLQDQTVADALNQYWPELA